MQKVKEWSGVVALVAIILLLVFVRGGDSNVGGGTRFVNGLSTDSTSPSAGQVRTTTLTVTATSTGASQGTVYYETKGGIDYAYVQQSMTATSSAICSIPNPYYGATTTVDSVLAQSTNAGIPNANNLYISTTTATSRYATTTAVAWNQGFPMGTGQWYYPFANASSTAIGDPNVLRGSNADGSSSYILGPTENLNFMFGTSTPGTFVTYDEGTCSASFSKP